MAKKRFHGGGENAAQTKKVYGKGMAADMKNNTKETMNRDSGMIREDWGEPCLLPRTVIDRDWPRSNNYMKYGEADLFMGVQKQLDEDASDMRRENKPKKY